MQYNKNDILSVLALFDKEDIPYINFKQINNKNTKNKKKIRKKGEQNDRNRTQ